MSRHYCPPSHCSTDTTGAEDLGPGGQAVSRRSDAVSWHAAEYITIPYLFRDVNNVA